MLPEAILEKKSDVTEFFKSLGYSVTWDFSGGRGERWWEIYDQGTMIMQVDMDIPLKAIITDLRFYHSGKGDRSKYDYTINAKQTPAFKTLLKKVYEHSSPAKGE